MVAALLVRWQTLFLLLLDLVATWLLGPTVGHRLCGWAKMNRVSTLVRCAVCHGSRGISAVYLSGNTVKALHVTR